MTRQIVHSAEAPPAIGPYSQAVRQGPLLFLSGQIPLVPETGVVVSGGIEAQTHRVMKNLGAVLAQAGASFSQVVKTTIYLVDLGEFNAMNQAYASYFPEEPPARATVQVAALPKQVRVEIDAIAVVDD
jgi:2-iminobutanoate/2-iminopropanoate deaminase